MEKKIGKRISFEKRTDSYSVSISQRVKPWQEALIFGWVALWLVCGFFFLSQYFISDDENQKIFIIIFMGFWSYLLFKALQILVWRLAGSEELVLSKGELKYKRAFAGIGRVRKANLKTVKNLGLIKYSEKSFKQSFESYFWSMGAEKVGFQTDKKYFMLGMQLEEKDAKLLADLINAGVKKFKN